LLIANIYSQAIGPCATGFCEFRQVRKEATVSSYSVCPRITCWPGCL